MLADSQAVSKKDRQEPAILADGEAISFEGALPASLDGLCRLVVSALEAQGRVLVSLLVDGKEQLGAEGSEELHSHRKIEFLSASAAELLQNLLTERLPALEKTVREIEQFSASILVVPWATVEEQIDRLRERLEVPFTLLQEIWALRQALSDEALASLRELHGRMEQVTERLALALENKDSGNLSGITAEEFAPSVAELFNVAVHIQRHLKEQER